MKSNLIVFQLIMFQAETSATAPMNPESQMQQQLHQQNQQQQQMQSKTFFSKNSSSHIVMDVGSL